MTLLIKNAIVVSSQSQKKADVLIKHGKIIRVEANIPAEGETINAEGLYLLPGAMDPQVHFRDPGMTWKEDLESGSRAAAAGGVTSFLDMPNTVPNTITAEIMAQKKAMAAEKSLVNYNFFIGATPDNVQELNNTPNVCGIKIFMGASTGSLLVHRTEDLEKIFSQGRRLIAVHAEDELTIQANKEKIKGSTDVHDHNLVRTPEAALKATQLAVSLAKKYQRRLHILHLTSQEEVEFLAKEKIPGLISVEVCPQHFLMHAPDIYDRLGTFGQMNPPIREKRHGEALWNALRMGIIDCIATDHAPHTIEEKEKGFPNSPSGMPGVETSLPLMLNQVNLGLCTIQEVVRWMCEKPVELYGVVNKGYITPGYDADLVLIDMQRKKTIENGKLQTKVNWSPYHGLTTQGWPIMTFVNGHMVYGEGEFFTEYKGRELQFNPVWEK